MERVKIIILDPSELVRQGFTAVLKAKSHKYEVKGLIDLNGLHNHIKQEWPNIVIINPSVYADNKGDRIKLLRQEAINHVFKLVAFVYAYCDEQILSLFDETIFINDGEDKIFSKLDKMCNNERSKAIENDCANLSQREIDVIRLIALGRSNKEIADELFISIHTVISHRKNITSKLGIKSASGITIYAVINKLISPEDFDKTF